MHRVGQVNWVGLQAWAHSAINCAHRLKRGVSAAGARSKRKVDEDDDEAQKSEPCHSHHAGVGHGTRVLRLDAEDGSHGSDDDCETEPCEPVHGAIMCDRRLRPVFNCGPSLRSWTPASKARCPRPSRTGQYLAILRTQSDISRRLSFAAGSSVPDANLAGTPVAERPGALACRCRCRLTAHGRAV
jgi:hypothetical protein